MYKARGNFFRFDYDLTSKQKKNEVELTKLKTKIKSLDFSIEKINV